MKVGLAKNYLILLLGVLVGIQALAFIPRADYVLKKAAERSGKGAFQIEKIAHFKDQINKFSLRESWLVQDERTLKLTVRTGHQVVYQALFLNGKKHIKGENPQSVGVDFFEPHFHHRSSKSWLTQLVQMKVLTPKALEAPVIRDLKGYQYQGDGEVRLARTQGLITFALGTPRFDAGSASNQFWFDQDQFQLVRMTFQTGAEVRTRGTKTSGKGMFHPAEVIVTSELGSISIETQSIESIKANAAAFDPKLLSPPRWDLLPSADLRPQIEGFYSRFR